VARLRRELGLFKKLTRDVGRIVAIASWNVPTGPPVLVGRIRQGGVPVKKRIAGLRNDRFVFERLEIDS